MKIQTNQIQKTIVGAENDRHEEKDTRYRQVCEKMSNISCINVSLTAH